MSAVKDMDITVRKIFFNDVSLCTQQTDIVCLSKKSGKPWEIPRKTPSQTNKGGTHELTSQEQSRTTERAQRLIDDARSKARDNKKARA